MDELDYKKANDEVNRIWTDLLTNMVQTGWMEMNARRFLSAFRVELEKSYEVRASVSQRLYRKGVNRNLTISEAEVVITQCKTLRLKGWEFMESLGPEKVTKACNGIGPEWFPIAVREQVSKIFSEFLICSHIHDCRYTYDNDGKKALFNAANKEFEKNCKKICNHEAYWWQVRYWRLRSRAGYLITNVKLFGWEAYQQAYKELVNGVQA